MIRTLPDESDAARLRQLHAALAALLAEHAPDRVGVERLFFQRNVQTAMAVGQARGVALLVAAQAGLTVDEPTPNEVKQAVCGNGAADKAQVADMVARLLGVSLTGVPDDATDALAVAIGCAYARDRQAAAGGRPMIGTLRGAVTHLGPDYVVVELGGVGYRVVVAPKLLARLRPEREAHFFIHHLVREDQQALFGFGSPEELAFFELLMTVTGVGPRLALAITSAHPVTRLQLAIVTDDLDLLTSVSGRRTKDRPAHRAGAEGEDPRRRHRGRAGGVQPIRTWWLRSSRWATPPRGAARGRRGGRHR